MPFLIEENRISYQDGEELLAEATFPAFKENVVNIDHTFVSEKLRGKGVAGHMMAAIIKELRRTGRTAIPTCSFAKRWFEHHPEMEDVLYKRR